MVPMMVDVVLSAAHSTGYMWSPHGYMYMHVLAALLSAAAIVSRDCLSARPKRFLFVTRKSLSRTCDVMESDGRNVSQS